MTQVSGLYLHVPFCRHLCNYCDFYKKRLEAHEKQFEEFHQFLSDALIEHRLLMQKQQVRWAPLESLYLGGGTPSLWGMEGLRYLRQNLFPEISFAADMEFTMEVDPGTWEDEMLLSWREAGLNRISIGTQSLDPTFLKIMDRAHSLDESHALLSYCQMNDWNFSLDFLLGLPYSRQEGRNIEKELETLLAYQPKHISLYILNARSKYPHTQHMPDDDFVREEYLFVSEFLRARGFHHYEVSNFALPGFESKHNMKYWKSESVAALGPTGTGLFSLSEESALRYKWKVSQAKVEVEELGIEELSLERTYLSLRTSLGWKPKKVSPELVNLFERWGELQYSHWDGKRVRLSSLGFLMLDSLMDDIFRIPRAAKAL